MRNDFESNYLEHSAKGTSWKAGVKYLKKIPLGNDKYYYIYTQAELNAWNKRHSVDANNVLSNKERDARKQAALSSGTSVDSMVRNGLKVKGQNAAEKTATLKKNIANGEAKIQQALESSKSSGSKKGSGSGGSSKKSGSGSKGGSSKSKSSKEKSGSSKEKTGSGKAAKEKTSAEKATRKEQNNTPISMDSLKKIYGKKDEDVSTFSGSASDFKKNLLDKYKDGAYGYLSAGNKVYKFTVQNGNVILKDFDSDKEVSFDSYLKNVKSFKEFQTNKKKK